MIPFSVFLGDEFLGIGVREHAFCDHYMCPECGNIWARTMVEGAAQHVCWSIRCPEHMKLGLWTAPTLFQEARYEKLRWPKEVLVRDFLFLMEHESELNSDQVIRHNPPPYSDALYDQHETA